MKDKTRRLLQDLEDKIHKAASEEYKIEVKREESEKKGSPSMPLAERREYIMVMDGVLGE